MKTEQIQAELKTLKAERTRLRESKNRLPPLWQDVDAGLFAYSQRRTQEEIDAVNEKIFALYDLL